MTKLTLAPFNNKFFNRLMRNGFLTEKLEFLIKSILIAKQSITF